MRKRILVLAMAALFTIGLMPHNAVHAANGATFSVSPQFSNEASKESGYFNLTAKAGDKITLPISITNRTSKEKTINVQAANAYTTDNGTVAYDPNGPKDKSAKHRLTEMVSDPVTVVIPGNQTKTATFTLTVPKSGIRGEVIGSLYAIDQDSYGSKKKSLGLSFKNRYAMTTAVMVRTSTKFITPKLKMPKVKAGKLNGQPAVLATLQNIEPQIFGKMRINAKVYQAGHKKPLLTRKVTGYSMAPNSHFNFGLPSKHAFIAGKYRIDLTAKSGNQTWHFGRYFTISGHSANKIDKATSVAPSLPWWIYLIIALLVLIIIWLIWRMKRQSKRS